MRESVRMVVVLTLIAMISAGVLSQVYNFTNGIILENLARELESAVFEVLPGSETVRTIEAGAVTMTEEDRSTLRERAGDDFMVFEGLDGNDNPVGFAFASEGTGYGGAVRVLVGVDANTKEVLAIKILSHLETPGLGSRIESEGFRNQFVGKTASDQIQVGRDIDSLSGATVSARAVAEAVRVGLEVAIPVYEGGR